MTMTSAIGAEKWSGGVHVVLNCKLDAAWSLQSDFLGLSSRFPCISECRLHEGEHNAVGCVRFLQGTGASGWVHERLLELDHDSHYMSYRMEDNLFVFPHGLQGYVTKIRMGEAGEGQCWVNWTYEVDPVATQTQGDITKFMIEFYTELLKYLGEAANELEAASADQSIIHKLQLPASQSAPIALSITRSSESGVH